MYLCRSHLETSAKNFTMPPIDPRILETEKVSTLLLRYAIPAIISTLATSLYNIVDRIFIGQGVGALAISGLALSFPIMTLLMAFGTLIGVGGSTRISIVLGMKDKERAERILGTAIVLTVVIWLVVCSSCLIFLDPLLRLFGGSDQTIPYATDYLRIIIPGSVLSNLAYSFSNIIRASGSPHKSMQVMLIGVVCNVILDPIFIFGFGMGIKGAAWATLISMFISASFTISYFFSPKSYIKLTWRNMRLRWHIVKDIVSIGMSPFLMNSAACVVNIILNNRLFRYGGDLAIGAYGIINSYAILFVMFVLGLCQGMQPIVGYNYGAGKIERSRKALFLSIKIATLITTFGFILSESIPRILASFFTPDEQLIEITQLGLRSVFAFFPFIGFQIVTGNYFQSIGMVSRSIFLSLTRQVLFLIPALIICSNIWGLPGVWFASPIADSASVCVAFFLLRQHIKSSNKAV